MFVITSYREVSVISNCLLARSIGIEPISRSFVGRHTIRYANRVYLGDYRVAHSSSVYCLIKDFLLGSS